MISVYASSNDHPTAPAMLAANSVETVVQLENTWAEVISAIVEIQGVADKSQNVSLLAALNAAEGALYSASAALNKASNIMRRDGL